MKRLVGLLVLGLILIASVWDSGAAAAAPAKLSPATEKAIANQYIVVLKDGANARSIAAVAGVSPKYMYEAALNGFAATLNAGQLTALQQHADVAYIEQDAEVSINTTQSVSGGLWGLDRIDQRSLPLNNTYTYNSTASTVTVYEIDTFMYTPHTQFTGRAANVYDALNGVGPICDAFGTHMAGTVGGATYGVAKQVRLRGLRVLDCGGYGSVSGVIAAIDWVRLNAQKPAVAHLPFAGAAHVSVDTAINNLANSGVFVVAFAGSNNADACAYSPARASGAYTVASSDSADNRASFSNYGACVDMYAPGVSVLSAWNTGTAATNTFSGSSSSAHVAGVAALYLSTNPTASTATVTSWLNSNATIGVIKNNPVNTPNRLLYKSTL